MSDVSPNSSAFWSPAGAPRRGKPARADAVLKNLRPEAQEILAEWCMKPMDRDEEKKPIKGTGGPPYAHTRLLAVAANVCLPALAVSERVVYDFFSWWRLEQDLEVSFEREKQVLEKTGDAKRAREAGETLLARLGLATSNPDLIEKAAYISDSRRRLDLDEQSGKTKARQKDAQIAQKNQDLKLAERRVALLEGNAAAAKQQLEAVKKDGGLTPETLRKIEEAAKLL